jgi:predicted CXXCH cytochrome family protein
MRMFTVLLAAAALTAPAAFAADAKAGKDIYDKSCKSCHGADGTPNPAMVKMLKVDMKDLKSADVQKLSADDIKKIVIEGKGKMKPVKIGGSADDVVAYVKTIK